MKGDLLDKRMRVYEELNDEKLRPDQFTIARIDGKNFSRFTRKELKVAPFDQDIRDAMISSLREAMSADFRCIYGFTQSDEISILLHPISNLSFSGKIRKFTSILASIVSSTFTLQMKTPAYFDCRVKQYPTVDTVLDYFTWRRIDSENNALNQLCYHYLTEYDDMTPNKAQKQLDQKHRDWKNEYLFKNHDINFNDLEVWKKRGISVYWVEEILYAVNKKTLENVKVKRNRLIDDMWLDKNMDHYRQFIYYKIILACNSKEKDGKHQTDHHNLCLPYPIFRCSDRYGPSVRRS